MHRLDGAYARIKRARKHLADLERRAKRRSEAHQKNITYEFDSDIQKVRLTHKGARPPSLAFGILTGEVVYNLRAALDYLVYELAVEDSGVVQEKTQFPIESTPRKFRDRRNTFLKGVSDAHVAAIGKLQPCNGCNWTRILASISNPDKHRHLTESKGMTDGGIFLEYGRMAEFLGRPGTIYPAQGRMRGKVYDVYVEVSSPVVIEFSDGVPVMQTLKELQASVTDTLDAFKPEFQ